MKRPILVVMLCLACSHCRLTGLEELGELHENGNLRRQLNV